MTSRLVRQAGTIAVLSTAASFGQPIYLQQLPEGDALPDPMTQFERSSARSNFGHPASIDLVHVPTRFVHDRVPITVAHVPTVSLELRSTAPSGLHDTAAEEEEYDFGDPAPVAVPREWFEVMKRAQVVQPNVDVMADEEPMG
ncbi:hypothetical protein FJV46_10505 [Arthrobacter agilis]|uniref:hypothetical protein n=1 Tax=Arthrobacter agilis TaxID=37921 RepID=UPI000B34BAC1|nr:hypothetical protein [Arthrobacter agilis]OUM44192.1 hypothetical protein B8W74_04775 [Arthrobacter agilis]PPB46566.1 hypothetical protein CI784_07065 [Arthrobacter agilis]TPV23777.1 hypothetical protein FJV46_10505 [Arthrobacter agilis]